MSLGQKKKINWKKPEIKVKVKSKKEEKELISVKNDKNDNYYVKISGKDTVYIVNSNKVERFKKSKSDLEKKG